MKRGADRPVVEPPKFDLVCRCGSRDVLFVEPGSDPDRFDDLFAVSRGTPMRCWCAEHWPWARLAARTLQAAAE